MAGSVICWLLAGIPAAGYMTLRNPTGEAIVLTGTRSPACGTLMLHRTETSGGNDRMVAVSKLTVPAKGEFRFASGGCYLMSTRPPMQVGEQVPATLRFADGSQERPTFSVVGANGAPNLAPARPAADGSVKMPT